MQAAIAGELRLLETSVRRSPEKVEALLHPEFFEFGASGRRWSRREIVEALAAEQRGDAGDSGGEAGGASVAAEAAVATVTDLAAVRLAADIVLVTYTSENGARRCNRSSIWRRTADGWRVYFHQGTITPARQTR